MIAMVSSIETAHVTALVNKISGTLVDLMNAAARGHLIASRLFSEVPFMSITLLQTAEPGGLSRLGEGCR